MTPAAPPLSHAHTLTQLKSGVERLSALRVLYLGNNRLRDWGEVERLGALGRLEDLHLVGNPLYNEARDAGTTAEYRVEARSARARARASAMLCTALHCLQGATMGRSGQRGGLGGAGGIRVGQLRGRGCTLPSLGITPPVLSGSKTSPSCLVTRCSSACPTSRSSTACPSTSTSATRRRRRRAAAPRDRPRWAS